MPLELHEVLEEEYVSMYGPLPRPSREYDEKDILDHDWAGVILQEVETIMDKGCGRAADGKTVAQELSALVVGDGSLQCLISSPALTERGKVLLQEYDDYAERAAKKGGKTAVEELRRGIVDEAFTGAVKQLRDVRLDNVYAALHKRAQDEGKARTALCISGGGIRSATFALGVIQGLASADILDRFDYLSTVSGGGYIGSWLSSWIRRHPRGVTGVKEDLQCADTAIAESRPAGGGAPKKRDLPKRKVNPEPAPLRHLREYSNYLSPTLGLFSGDTWTLASLYIRNLLLNLLVLIPLLALALAFPRIFSWLLELRELVLPPVAWAWIAAVLTTVGCAYLGHKRPVEQGERAQTKAGTSTSAGSFILGCVLPLIGAAVALAVFWARAKQPGNERFLTDPWTYGAAALAFLGMTLVPYALYYRRYLTSLPAERRTSFAPAGDLRKVHPKAHLKKQGREGTALLIAVLTTFALLWLLAVKVFDEPLRPVPTVETLAPIDRANVPASPQAQLYVAFAVPLVLLVFYLQASIFVGLSAPVNADSDREWWGRAGAWLLAFAAGLAILNAIAVFGPVAFYYAPVILASIGGGAGVAAALLGYSDKTAAKEKEDAGTAAKVTDLGSVLMVPVFIAALLAAISLGSTWVIQQLTDDDRIIQASRYKEQALLQARFEKSEQTKAGMKTLATTPSPRVSIPALEATAHLQTVQHTSGTQVLIFLAVGALAAVLSLFIGV
ncbi:MAG: patatin-like phospholipase family protein, partial [Gammaproteobacteria bacterium]